MKLTEWLQQFESEFSAEAKTPSPQHPDWPDGASCDPTMPWWVENTGKTYETVDDAVADMGGELPSHASFGVVKFDP